MKKLFFAVAAMLVATTSFAQFGGGMGMGEFKPEDMAKRQADNLKEQLSLTQAQTDSIYKVYFAQSQEMAKMFENMQNGGGEFQMPSQEEMEARQKARQAQEEKIKSFLTDDQKKQYDKIQEERRQQMGGFGGGAPMGGFGGGAPMGGPQGGAPQMGQRPAPAPAPAPAQDKSKKNKRK